MTVIAMTSATRCGCCAQSLSVHPQVFMMRDAASEAGAGPAEQEGLHSYKLVARSSLDVQEIDVRATLDRETMKAVLADLLEASIAA